MDIIVNAKEFGLRVLTERRRKGWTQDRTASKMGVSKQSISLIERGESIPSKSTLDKMRKVFPQLWNGK